MYSVQRLPQNYNEIKLRSSIPSRFLTHSELAPLRVPLVPMEHCTSRFFQECDADKDKLVSFKEWTSCFGIKNGKSNRNTNIILYKHRCSAGYTQQKFRSEYLTLYFLIHYIIYIAISFCNASLSVIYACLAKRMANIVVIYIFILLIPTICFLHRGYGRQPVILSFFFFLVYYYTSLLKSLHEPL